MLSHFKASAVSTKPLESHRTGIWTDELTCQSFEEEVAFVMCIEGSIVTNGILECDYFRLAVCLVE